MSHNRWRLVFTGNRVGILLMVFGFALFLTYLSQTQPGLTASLLSAPSILQPVLVVGTNNTQLVVRVGDAESVVFGRSDNIRRFNAVKLISQCFECYIRSYMWLKKWQ